MVKVRLGAIIKEVPKGSLIWYKKAGWQVINESKVEKPKEENIDLKTEPIIEIPREVKNETNTKKNATK